MLGLYRHQWVFQPPPCICSEIEARVQEVCAMRDEMASWDTPINAWQKLWTMSPLMSKPQPKGDAWSDAYSQALSVPVRGGLFVHRGTSELDLQTVPIYEGMGPCLQLLPDESYQVGTVLVRGDTRYKITERLFDNTNRVVVRKL